MGAQLLTPQEVSFHRRQSHGLTKITKLLAKEQEYLVDRLLELTRSETGKVAFDACKELIGHHKDCVEAIEKDAITRSLLTIKYGGSSRNLGAEDNFPIVDFSNIQSIE